MDVAFDQAVAWCYDEELGEQAVQVRLLLSARIFDRSSTSLRDISGHNGCGSVEWHGRVTAQSQRRRNLVAQKGCSTKFCEARNER